MAETLPRLLFVTFWSFDGEESNGICKKIRAQVRAFEKAGFGVELVYVKAGSVWLDREGTPLRLGRSLPYVTRIAAAAALRRYLKRERLRYPAVYIRYAQGDPALLGLLSQLNAGGSRIVTELPTYPYDQEFSTSLPLRLSLLLDKCARKRYVGRIHRFAVYAACNRVYGVPAMHITNGMDFDALRPCAKSAPSPDGIHMISVSTLSFWHGYERLIRSMGEYVRRGGRERFIFHVVGDGDQRPLYEKTAAEYGLEDRVVFHGFVGGAALDALYDLCDLGISPLTAFRKGLYGPESLKTVEYLAKGLPVLATQGPNPYEALGAELMLVSADEGEIDMDAVAAFTRGVYAREGYAAAHTRIRALAAPICSIDASFRPITEFLKGEKEA